MAHARIAQPNDKLTFTVQQKAIPNNGTAYVVMDSEGYMCGFYASEKDVKRAIPKIASNLKHGNCKPLKHKAKSFQKR